MLPYQQDSMINEEPRSPKCFQSLKKSQYYKCTCSSCKDNLNKDCLSSSSRFSPELQDPLKLPDTTSSDAPDSPSSSIPKVKLILNKTSQKWCIFNSELKESQVISSNLPIPENLKTEELGFSSENKMSDDEDQLMIDMNRKKATKQAKTYFCRSDDCREYFKNSKHRTEHEEKIHFRIACPFPECKKLVRPSVLSRHIKVTHEKSKTPEMVRCNNCCEMVKKSQFEKHEKRCLNASEDLKCSYTDCSKVVKSPGELKQHINMAHTYAKCPHKTCNKTLKVYSLKSHISNVHSNCVGKCFACSEEMQFSIFHQHIRNCAPDLKEFKGDEFHCLSHKLELLPEYGIFKDSLPLDLSAAQQQNTFRCEENGCQLLFDSNAMLERHKKNVHSPRIPCPIAGCGKMVKPASMWSHKKTHESPRRRAICPKCLNEMTKPELTQHIINCGVKSEEEPCEPFDGTDQFMDSYNNMAFKNSYHMNFSNTSHQLIHQPINTYPPTSTFPEYQSHYPMNYYPWNLPQEPNYMMNYFMS